MHRYSAQEQFQKATQTTKSMPDVVILRKLQIAAEQEKKQSELETEKQWGSRVQYRTTMVQVGIDPTHTYHSVPSKRLVLILMVL